MSEKPKNDWDYPPVYLNALLLVIGIGGLLAEAWPVTLGMAFVWLAWVLAWNLIVRP